MFETHFKILNSWFLYIKHVVTRNKFTSFRPSKLVTFTLLTAKENLYMNFLRTIFSSLVNKNFNYIVILFLCYVFSFVSKDFVLPSYVEVSMNSKSERIFSKKKKKFRKIFQSILCRMKKYNLVLSTNVLLYDVLTILIHHFVLFFRTLSQK